ncbi:LuxR C-terminal-related transcriptional regulator [Kiloniella sp.]|uniref:LuxR C-terminal-related transcriptional regulator n=1 Tax=Kiloniella sp. TaxID=1938587 RepID=UPI003B02B585
MAYSLKSQFNMLNDHMDEAVKWGNHALELEKQHPNVEVRIHALNNIGSAMVLRGNEEGEAHLQTSLSLSLELGFHEHAARVYTNMSDYCVKYKKLELAEKFIADGIAFDTRYDLDSWTYYLIGILAQLRMEQGRLRDAETIAQGVLGLDKLTLLMKLPALSVLARVQLRLNRPNYKKTLNQAIENAFSTDELQYIIPARLCAVEAAWLHKNDDAAYQQLKFLTELDDSKIDHWSAGEIAVWIRRFGFDLPYNTSLSLPEPYTLELKGKFTEAANKWQSLGLPYNAALSLMQVGKDEAIEALPKAYKILETMEAKTGLSMIRSKAEEFGLLNMLPRSRRGPYKISRQHPIGLTSKEQEILGFILDGVSNREISKLLSRSQRTIENHVSSILSKLNVPNRLGAMLRVQSEPWLAPQRSTVE